MKNLGDVRTKLATHTSVITMSLNLLSLGFQGRLEQQIEKQGGDLSGIRESVNYIAAKLSTRIGDDTTWTEYASDDKEFWRSLRRGLNRKGYPSTVLYTHETLIQAYVHELGERGAFDAQPQEEINEHIPATYLSRSSSFTENPSRKTSPRSPSREPCL